MFIQFQQAGEVQARYNLPVNASLTADRWTSGLTEEVQGIEGVCSIERFQKEDEAGQALDDGLYITIDTLATNQNLYAEVEDAVGRVALTQE